jgi:cellulose synthase operon protein C
MLRSTLAVLCIFASFTRGGLAEPPKERKAQTAETLRQLRMPFHKWLARDVGEKTLMENQAYADLIIAFGLARLGEQDEVKKLLQEAATVLEKGDPTHRCLVALYRYRIEQVVAGKPLTGTLPPALLATVTPTGKEGVGDPITMHHYTVLRARELSRIIEPLEQVDPYLPWTSKGSDDPLVGRLGLLQDELEPEQFEREARKLLKEIAASSVETRLRVTGRLAALAPRAGDAFGAELLKGVPELVRVGWKAEGESMRAYAVSLAEHSLTLATNLKKPDLFKPLVAEVIELIGTAQDVSATGVIARLTIRCEHGFRVMVLRDAAKAFLKDTAGKLPNPADAAAIRATAGKSWPEAARTLLAEAGMRQVAGQGAEAEKILALVRDALLRSSTVEGGISYYRLVAEYAAAAGRLGPVEAKKVLEEVLTKLTKVPDTYTTSTHYSRYHLMILEAAVLGLTAEDI